MRKIAFTLILFFCGAALCNVNAPAKKTNAPIKSESMQRWLEQENAPLGTKEASVTRTNDSKQSVTKMAIGLAIVLTLGGLLLIGYRIMKKQPLRQGSRKYLIERMSYCSLGPKMGVSLLKVGKEFVLVGVTPNQINFLSNVPKLAETYQEESKFETENFKTAVEQEFHRIKGTA